MANGFWDYSGPLSLARLQLTELATPITRTFTGDDGTVWVWTDGIPWDEPPSLRVIMTEEVEGYPEADLDCLGDLSNWRFVEVDGDLHALWKGPGLNPTGESELAWYNSERYWGVVQMDDRYEVVDEAWVLKK